MKIKVGLLVALAVMTFAPAQLQSARIGNVGKKAFFKEIIS